MTDFETEKNIVLTYIIVSVIYIFIYCHKNSVYITSIRMADVQINVLKNNNIKKRLRKESYVQIVPLFPMMFLNKCRNHERNHCIVFFIDFFYQKSFSKSRQTWSHIIKSANKQRLPWKNQHIRCLPFHFYGF